MCIGTLARSAHESEQDLSTEVELSLEAPQRCSPRERHSGDCTKGSQDAHEPNFHRSILRDPDYQGLKAWMGATLDPPRGLRVPSPWNTKTDLTRKSVGCTTSSTSTLSAHFRWGHQRVRAFPECTVPSY